MYEYKTIANSSVSKGPFNPFNFKSKGLVVTSIFSIILQKLSLRSSKLFPGKILYLPNKSIKLFLRKRNRRNLLRKLRLSLRFAAFVSADLPLGHASSNNLTPKSTNCMLLGSVISNNDHPQLATPKSKPSASFFGLSLISSILKSFYFLLLK